MKIIIKLRSPDYPIINYLPSLKENAEIIVSIVRDTFPAGIEKVRFFGIGTSGAMLMTAIALSANNDNFTFHVIRKIGEETHRNRISNDDFEFGNTSPIIIVDDKVATGRTMEKIRDMFGAIDNSLLSSVQIVAAYNAEAHEDQLKTYFPNLKLIIA